MVIEYLTLGFFMLVFGVSGALAVGINYILESMNKYDKNHKAFSWVNLYSSVALMSYSVHGEVWLFAGLNLFLSFVGLFGLYEVYFKVADLEKNTL